MSRCQYQLLAAGVGLEGLPGSEGLGPLYIIHANQPVQEGRAITNPTQLFQYEQVNQQGSYSSALADQSRTTIPESITKTQLTRHFFEVLL